MLDEFSRTALLIGADGLAKLARSKVAVFGVGGVGSFVVEGLVRAGVGKFVLIDNDCVCRTNINRQLHATSKTVGQPKVGLMKKRILEINPVAEVETFQEFYLPENAESMIKDDYDYIVDAIDTVTAKLDLIVRAKTRKIPIISAMGAGNKLDPTKFEVADIYETSVDPLARVIRQQLKKLGITSLKVVYSKELPLVPGKNDNSNGATQRCTVRRQIPGSISFVPSVAGLIIAGEVVKDIVFDRV